MQCSRILQQYNTGAGFVDCTSVLELDNLSMGELEILNYV